MAYIITTSCTGVCDTACVDVCPCDCIHGFVPVGEIRAVPAAERARHFAGMQLFIDPDVCIDCGACEPECPVAAIFEESSVPDEHQGDVQANADFFARRASV